MTDMPAGAEEPDAQLLRAARAGDASSLGLLLARHRAGMHAVAAGLLGYGPEAEDAVQEASIVALRRIGDIRDPDAVGPWLRTVVRNVCRAMLRRTSAVPLETDALVRLERSTAPDPAELIEQYALRDWIGTALAQLSPGLRLAMLLRYFTETASYEDIAAVSAVPVGTVRSRLHQGRAKLAEALLAAADGAHDDIAALTGRHRGLGEEAMLAAHRGESASVLRKHWSPKLEVVWPDGRRTGRDRLVAALGRDLSAGVRHSLVNVVAGGDVVVWEDAMRNPPEDPYHCPPGVTWVYFLEGGQAVRLHLHHPRRPVR
ncbi:RNA polymerase sigma factor [Streptomyces sp. NPDC059224]|uniref:RNA polymerase sigma factor n=1 Tax=Streptomyces sp. NPDC059224 TaxID=3346775 RepID=UPI003688563C